jgi:hypothetical protein
MSLKAAIYGLSKEGMSVAQRLKSLGHEVYLIDEVLQASLAPSSVPSFEELVKEEALAPLASVSSAVEASELLVFAPRLKGDLQPDYVKQALKNISRYIRKGTTVLTLCPLPFGVSSELEELVQAFSGLSRGKDFYFCYMPEPHVLGVGSNAERGVVSLARALGLRREAICSLYDADLMFLKLLIDRLSDVAGSIELGRRGLRSRRTAFVDEFVELAYDLQVVGSTLEESDHLKQLASPILRIIKAYTKYLHERIRLRAKEKGMRLGALTLYIVWGLEPNSIRPAKALALNDIMTKMRESFGDVRHVRSVEKLPTVEQNYFVMVCDRRSLQEGLKRGVLTPFSLADSAFSWVEGGTPWLKLQ